MRLDRLLRDLISSVATAIDEYSNQVGDYSEEPDLKKDAVSPNAAEAEVKRAIYRSSTVEEAIRQSIDSFTEGAKPSSSNADQLTRRLRDTESLARLARTELEMPSVVVCWFRAIAARFTDYPAILQSAGDAIRASVDLIEPFVTRWNEQKERFEKYVFNEVKNLGDVLVEVGRRLELARIGCKHSRTSNGDAPQDEKKEPASASAPDSLASVEKILLAGRGVGCIRVLRACREARIPTVVVHSTIDAEEMPVRLADESVCVGPAPEEDSYLNLQSILSAAAITGAGIIHPCYGRLSLSGDALESAEKYGVSFCSTSSFSLKVAMNHELLSGVFENPQPRLHPQAITQIKEFGILDELEFHCVSDVKGNTVIGGCVARHSSAPDVSLSGALLGKVANSEGFAQQVHRVVEITRIQGVFALSFGVSDRKLELRTIKPGLQATHPAIEVATGGSIAFVMEQVGVATGRLYSEEIRLLSPVSYSVQCEIRALTRGRVVAYHTPGGSGVRLESYIYSGYVVPDIYEDLIGTDCVGLSAERRLR